MKRLLLQLAVSVGFFMISANVYAGNVVGCVTKFQDVNYYEVRNITRCVANISHVDNGEYVVISTPQGRKVAYARVIKHAHGQATLLFAKPVKSIKKGFLVKAQGSGFIPEDDREISRYTQLIGGRANNNDDWRQDF